MNNVIESQWSKIKRILDRHQTMADCFANLDVHCAHMENEMRYKVGRYARGTLGAVSSIPELSNLARVCSQRACELLADELEASRSPHFALESETENLLFVLNKDRGKTYEVQKKTWKCSCSTCATYLLPCRHIAFVRRQIEKEHMFPLRSVNRRWRVQDLVADLYGEVPRDPPLESEPVSSLSGISISTSAPNPSARQRSLSSAEKYRMVQEVVKELTSFLTASTGTEQFLEFLGMVENLRDVICYQGIGTNTASVEAPELEPAAVIELPEEDSDFEAPLQRSSRVLKTKRSKKTSSKTSSRKTPDPVAVQRVASQESVPPTLPSTADDPSWTDQVIDAARQVEEAVQASRSAVCTTSCTTSGTTFGTSSSPGCTISSTTSTAACTTSCTTSTGACTTAPVTTSHYTWQPRKKRSLALLPYRLTPVVRGSQTVLRPSWHHNRQLVWSQRLLRSRNLLQSKRKNRPVNIRLKEYRRSNLSSLSTNVPYQRKKLPNQTKNVPDLYRPNQMKVNQLNLTKVNQLRHNRPRLYRQKLCRTRSPTRLMLINNRNVSRNPTRNVPVKTKVEMPRPIPRKWTTTSFAPSWGRRCSIRQVKATVSWKRRYRLFFQI